MNAYQKTALTTVIAVVVLITVGSLVRVAGAGLGCPDWPRCWGCWLPPASIEELDMAYIEAKGYDINEFNPTKMWIEYINRMVGVLIGILIFITFLRSFPYRSTQPAIFNCSLCCLLLVGFQGWLGGQVVRSGLIPGIITLHMVLAVILLCVLIYTTFEAMKSKFKINLPEESKRFMIRITTVLFALTCMQLILGTQVREAIDPFIKDPESLPRSQWLNNAGWYDHIHRASSWLVLIAGILLFRWVRKHEIIGVLRVVSTVILVGIVIQLLLGITLAYGDLPKAAQVMHVTIATLLICTEFYGILAVRRVSVDIAGGMVVA